MAHQFLPTTQADLRARGWAQLDIIIVSGDAYVDHPSYGAAIIGRVLESQGYRVGIIAQPDWRSTTDFMRLGRPRLCFGVTAGNIDSMVAHYTAERRLRRDDDFSPGGAYGLRPNRATIVYSNRVREAFPGVPVVIGGIEASLRRLAHYDYWEDCVRRSILLDSKADILVYGNGEEQMKEIVRRLSKGEDVQSIDDVRGTVFRRGDLASVRDFVEMPSFEEAASDRMKFCEAFRVFLGELNPWTARAVVQKSSGHCVIQLPPPIPVSGEALDCYYELPYCRAPYPSYAAAGGVPGFETVSGSITTHRGCFGGCSFCALHAHQGKTVVSRSVASLVRETTSLAACDSFHGIITDAGGPTANMYGLGCKDQTARSQCRRASCLMPNVCRNLRTDHRDYLDVLRALKEVKGVRNVFVATGIRHDLALADSSGAFIEGLCRHHVGGQIKVAPEHAVDVVLKVMNKPPYEVYERFLKEYSAANQRLRLKQYQVEYYMSGHPGCRTNDMAELSRRLKGRGVSPRQAQAFTPTPMTLSTCMYYTGINPLTGEEVYIPKGARERREQLGLMQWKARGRGQDTFERNRDL